MRKKVFIIWLIVLMTGCNRYKEKDINELKYLPISQEEILVEITSDSYEEFPTIIKFNQEDIIISTFQDSNEYDTGYEDVKYHILEVSYIEYGDVQKTVYKTDYLKLIISTYKGNYNIYEVEGLDPNKNLTYLGVSDNLLKQILNLKE